MQIQEAIKLTGSAESLALLLRWDVARVKRTKKTTNLSSVQLDTLKTRAPHLFAGDATPWCVLKEIDAKRETVGA